MQSKNFNPMKPHKPGANYNTTPTGNPTRPNNANYKPAPAIHNDGMPSFRPLGMILAIIGGLGWFITSLPSDSGMIETVCRIACIAGISMLTNNLIGFTGVFGLLYIMSMGTASGINHIIITWFIAIIASIVINIGCKRIVNNKNLPNNTVTNTNKPATKTISSTASNTNDSTHQAPPITTMHKNTTSMMTHDSIDYTHLTPLTRWFAVKHDGIAYRTAIILNSILLTNIIGLIFVIMLNAANIMVKPVEALIRLLSMPTMLIIGAPMNQDLDMLLNTIISSPIGIIVLMLTIWMLYAIPSLAIAVIISTSHNASTVGSAFISIIGAPFRLWMLIMNSMFGGVFRNKAIHAVLAIIGIIVFIAVIIVSMMSYQAPKHWGNQYGHGIYEAGSMGVSTQVMLTFIASIVLIIIMMAVCTSWAVTTMPYWAPVAAIMLHQFTVSPYILQSCVAVAIIASIVLIWFPLMSDYCWKYAVDNLDRIGNDAYIVNKDGKKVPVAYGADVKEVLMCFPLVPMDD